ncbi:MAG: DMT family transporter [Bacteroidota bacterium]
MTLENKDFLHLHFIVLIWGFTAILGLLITLPPVEVVFFRTLIASLGLVVLLYFQKRNFRLPIRAFWIIIGTGALIAIHWITFFLSARLSNASVCLAGMATCSLWTSLLEPLAQKQKVKGFEVILSVIAFAGIGVIFNVEFSFLTGLLVAIFSAFISAVFTVINGKLSKRYDPFVITFYEMLGACVSILIFFPTYTTFFVEQILWVPTASDWLWLLILALACTVYAYSASVELMKRLSAFSINLVVNLEPVYGIILALVIFGSREEMSIEFYLGTGLILISVSLYPVLNRRHRKKALTTDIIR